MESKQMLERCVDFAKEKKAQDILALDFDKISEVTVLALCILLNRSHNYLRTPNGR